MFVSTIAFYRQLTRLFIIKNCDYDDKKKYRLMIVKDICGEEFEHHHIKYYHHIKRSKYKKPKT